jgi:hypothetical protein
MLNFLLGTRQKGISLNCKKLLNIFQIQPRTIHIDLLNKFGNFHCCLNIEENKLISTRTWFYRVPVYLSYQRHRADGEGVKDKLPIRY